MGKQKNSVERLEENTEESQQPSKKTKRWYKTETKNKKNKKILIKLESQSRKFNIQITEVSERSENIEGEIIIEECF